jgi:hypothetical protein
MTTNVIDELQLYRGKDFDVSPHIILRQPILDEVCEFGEKQYYGTVFALTATSSDYKVQLYDMGIDYENISDYDFFVMMTRNVTAQDTYCLFSKCERFNANTIQKVDANENINEAHIEIKLSKKPDPTYNEIFIHQVYSDKTIKKHLLLGNTVNDDTFIYRNNTLVLPPDAFGNCDYIYVYYNALDLSKFSPMPKNNEIILSNDANGAIIDRVTYTIIVDYLRKAHYLERHFDLAGNEYTKKWFVDHDRKMAARQKKRPFESMLLPLISAMTNTSEFKYRFDDVWTLRIYPFMDAVRRVQKIKQYNNTMHGVYAGTVDLKKINQEELNWIGKLSTSSS